MTIRCKYAHCITESCTIRCTIIIHVHIQYRCLHLCKLTMCDRAYIRLRLLKIYKHICTCTHHRCKSVYLWRHSLSQLHGYNCMWLTLQIGVYRLYSIPMSHNSIIWWSTAWSNSTSSLTYCCTLNEIAHIYIYRMHYRGSHSVLRPFIVQPNNAQTPWQCSDCMVCHEAIWLLTYWKCVTNITIDIQNDSQSSRHCTPAALNKFKVVKSLIRIHRIIAFTFNFKTLLCLIKLTKDALCTCGSFHIRCE